MEEKALRYNEGKPELHYLLTFPEALRAIARVSTCGARKYEAYNYLKGAPASESVGSALRHLLAWWGGENNDPESELHHLAHFAWNAIRLVDEVLSRKPGVDDRPQLVAGNPSPLAASQLFQRALDIHKERIRAPNSDVLF